YEAPSTENGYQTQSKSALGLRGESQACRAKVARFRADRGSPRRKCPAPGLTRAHQREIPRANADMGSLRRKCRAPRLTRARQREYPPASADTGSAAA